MVTHTIEELHELFKSGELDVKEYYKELFEEAKKQQERLNAFVTITEDEAYKAIEAPMTDDLFITYSICFKKITTTLRVLRQLHLVRC